MRERRSMPWAPRRAGNDRGKPGGPTGNRTRVQGFAVLCVTTPPSGLDAVEGGYGFFAAGSTGSCRRLARKQGRSKTRQSYLQCIASIKQLCDREAHERQRRYQPDRGDAHRDGVKPAAHQCGQRPAGGRGDGAGAARTLRACRRARDRLPRHRAAAGGGADAEPAARDGKAADRGGPEPRRCWRRSSPRWWRSKKIRRWRPWPARRWRGSPA